jgi:hypothetical protein
MLIRSGSVYSLSFDCLSLLESLEVSKFVGQFVRGQSRLLGTRLNQQTLGRSTKLRSPFQSMHQQLQASVGQLHVTNALSFFKPPIVSFPRSTLIALRPRFDSE